MANKITEVSTKRGHDIRDSIMIAGGGGGPIHGGFIADALGIKRVVVPPVAALYSAFGMFAMDIGQDYARSFVGRTNNIDRRRHSTASTPSWKLRRKPRSSNMACRPTRSSSSAAPICATSASSTKSRSTWPVAGLPARRWTPRRPASARKHEELYTFAMPWKAVEILTLRLKATTPNAPFALPQVAKGDADPKPALKRRRTCRFNGRDVDTPIYDGEKVMAGNVISGPAIIEETTTTVVIPEAYVCSVDKYKNYILTRS